MTGTGTHLLSPPKLPLPLGLRPALPWEGFEGFHSELLEWVFSSQHRGQCPLQALSLPGLCRSAHQCITRSYLLPLLHKASVCPGRHSRCHRPPCPLSLASCFCYNHMHAHAWHMLVHAGVSVLSLGLQIRSFPLSGPALLAPPPSQVCWKCLTWGIRFSGLLLSLGPNVPQAEICLADPTVHSPMSPS